MIRNCCNISHDTSNCKNIYGKKAEEERRYVQGVNIVFHYGRQAVNGSFINRVVATKPKKSEQLQKHGTSLRNTSLNKGEARESNSMPANNNKSTLATYGGETLSMSTCNLAIHNKVNNTFKK